MNTFAKLAILLNHGYMFSNREYFNKYAPQAKKDNTVNTKGQFALFDPSDGEEGWALVGDDGDEIIRESYEALL